MAQNSNNTLNPSHVLGWYNPAGVRQVRVMFVPEHGVDARATTHLGDLPMPQALALLRAKHAEMAWPCPSYHRQRAAGLAVIEAFANGAESALVPVQYGALLAF